MLLSILLSYLGLLEKLSLPLQGISLTPLSLLAISFAIIILFYLKEFCPKLGDIMLFTLSYYEQNESANSA